MGASKIFGGTLMSLGVSIFVYYSLWCLVMVYSFMILDNFFSHFILIARSLKHISFIKILLLSYQWAYWRF